MPQAISFQKILSMILGLMGVCAAMTILFLGMRAVMDVGGYCAEGGPYQIAVHCPTGVAALMPLSIFLGLAFAGLYATSLVRGGPNATLLFWTALFGSLGWNFLEYGLKSPAGGGMDISWLICGVLFFLMAIFPLFGLGWSGLREALFGSRISSSHGNQLRIPIWYNLLHGVSIFAGIYGGYLLFIKVT